MRVPLLDLKSQYAGIKGKVDAAVAEVFASQRFVLGQQVEACEAAIAEYAGCAYAVGVGSGTDAILAALMAEGIGPGDEVITTPYTFFSTAGCIARLGATPVFVDINPLTYNMDPRHLESRITNATRAIIPVHLYGQMAQMGAIMGVARKYQLSVIEDAAQAIGAGYEGKRAGTVGDYGCFSFYPSKNLSGAGDGGMVITDDPERAALLRRIRSHGAEPKYHHTCIGGNFRLNELQAAVVRVKLPYLDAWIEQRQTNAERYNNLLRDAGVTENTGVGLPRIVTNRHVFNQYVIRLQDRDDARKYLLEHGIDCEVYYPSPLHLQPCFAYLEYEEGDYPESEAAARNTLALPIYPELTDIQAGQVVQAIKNFVLG